MSFGKYNGTAPTIENGNFKISKTEYRSDTGDTRTHELNYPVSEMEAKLINDIISDSAMLDLSTYFFGYKSLFNSQVQRLYKNLKEDDPISFTEFEPKKHHEFILFCKLYHHYLAIQEYHWGFKKDRDDKIIMNFSKKTINLQAEFNTKILKLVRQKRGFL